MDSDEETEAFSVRGIAASIILINIFDPKLRKSSEQAHVATCQLIRHYLRTQSSQYIGVSLYGTDDDDPSIFAQKCVKDIFPLTSPSLDDYKKLETTNISDVKQSKELVLSEVLGHCSKMFSACKKTLSTRTIIMLTSLDEPPTSNDRDPTLECVVDLVKSGIQIKIMNIAETDYEIHEFYNDFLVEVYQLDAEKEQITMPNCVWDPEEIKNNLITQSDRHLAISELPFELGAGISMCVKIYKLLKSQTAPKSSYSHKDTNISVVSTTKVMKYIKDDPDMDMDQDENQEKKTVPLLKEETLNCQEYGGENLEFTQNEINLIKNPFGSNMLKLLGFKSANILRKEKWFIENCYFLFPSEGKIEGSTIAFKALYHACDDMKVVAICILRTRVNSRPRLVALSPCTKPFGINVDCGFDVIVLPFVESVRDLPDMDDNNDIEISEEQKSDMVTILNDIIDKTTFDYRPDMFENPVLQYKYRAIEAKALQDTEIAEIHDTTKPNEKIFEHLNEVKFNELFGPFGLPDTKRVAETKSSSAGKKKVKTEDIDQDLLLENIKNQKLNNYSVDQLRKILTNLKVAGVAKKRKSELMKLIYDQYA